jgi:hypothetical protein
MPRMKDRNLLRGLVLIAIALAFGLGALRYPTGTLARAGPGLFPLMVASLLLLVGIATVVRSRFGTPQALAFNPKNVALIVGSLCGFAIASSLTNMTVGIVALVFIATLAGSTYSLKRNVAIAAVLVAVAFGFRKLLGLQLPLW